MSFMNVELSKQVMAAIVQDPGMNVARVEIKKGYTTRRHRHETECVIVVLQGEWRFRLPGRTVTVAANQMLRIPPGEEHTAEAMSDTVALSISSAAGDWSGCCQYLPEEPDQYLWGV
jgi:quercetin dioxygenase-like cupin family protein